MMGANTGIGAPIIVALHLSEPSFSMELVWVATLLTIALCAIAVYGATKFIPQPLGIQRHEEQHYPLSATA